MSVVLYGYWRSLATYRVRAALNFKGIEYSESVVDLSKGEQFGERYHRVNAQHVLPVLEHNGVRLSQSLPIVEYIDETWPDQPLLPDDAKGRARVRALAQITTADVHPLIVPRVRNYLEQEFRLDESDRMKWIQHWFSKGSEAIEALLAADNLSGIYAHGNRVSLADMALVSHVIGARLFKVDLTNAPTLETIADRCLQLDAFARAHPLSQPDAPKPIA